MLKWTSFVTKPNLRVEGEGKAFGKSCSPKKVARNDQTKSVINEIKIVSGISGVGGDCGWWGP